MADREGKPGRKAVNAKRATELLDSGLTYRAAGAALAGEEGRRVAYTEQTILRATKRWTASKETDHG